MCTLILLYPSGFKFFVFSTSSYSLFALELTLFVRFSISSMGPETCILTHAGGESTEEGARRSSLYCTLIGGKSMNKSLSFRPLDFSIIKMRRLVVD
jgi:hypothetical protein